MTANYIAPVYHSRFLGDVEVEHTIDIILITEEKSLRDGLLLELYQHLADYECPRLRRDLAVLSSKFGHKRYNQPPTMPYILQPGVELPNVIFKTRIHDAIHREDVEIDLRLLRLWIKQNFFSLCKHQYSWFALWKFFKDKKALKNENIADFCGQMEEWFFDPTGDLPLKPNKDSVWRYNGYLSDTPYIEWNDQEFETNKRNNQRFEGYKHLKGICYALAGKWNVRLLKQIDNKE